MCVCDNGEWVGWIRSDTRCYVENCTDVYMWIENIPKSGTWIFNGDLSFCDFTVSWTYNNIIRLTWNLFLAHMNTNLAGRAKRIHVEDYNKDDDYYSLRHQSSELGAGLCSIEREHLHFDFPPLSQPSILMCMLLFIIIISGPQKDYGQPSSQPVNHSSIHNAD